MRMGDIRHVDQDGIQRMHHPEGLQPAPGEDVAAQQPQPLLPQPQPRAHRAGRVGDLPHQPVQVAAAKYSQGRHQAQDANANPEACLLPAGREPAQLDPHQSASDNHCRQPHPGAPAAGHHQPA